jgi:hypothetical protein
MHFIGSNDYDCNSVAAVHGYAGGINRCGQCSICRNSRNNTDAGQAVENDQRVAADGSLTIMKVQNLESCCQWFRCNMHVNVFWRKIISPNVNKPHTSET